MKTGVEVDRGSKGSQAVELDEDRGSIIKGPDEEKGRGTSKQEVSYMCKLATSLTNVNLVHLKPWVRQSLSLVLLPNGIQVCSPKAQQSQSTDTRLW